MGDVKLSTPLVTVIHRNMADPLVIQTENPDMLLWEKTRGRPRWPKFDASPVHWLTFLSGAAAKRLSLTEETWETWADNVRSVASAEDEADDEQGKPFPEGDEDTPYL